MPLNSRKRSPVGRHPETPVVVVKPVDSPPGLALPHERDESAPTARAEPDPAMLQAKRDIDAGMVDTDMRATPGVDAQERDRLVPGPGGKAPSGS